MGKRHDYRNHIKQLTKEGLIKTIDYYTDLVVERAGIMDFTRELKILCYAKDRLKKIDNEKTEYKGIDSIANDYINTLI